MTAIWWLAKIRDVSASSRSRCLAVLDCQILKCGNRSIAALDHRRLSVAAIVSLRPERQLTRLADTRAAGYDVSIATRSETGKLWLPVQEDGLTFSMQLLDELLTSLANA